MKVSKGVGVLSRFRLFLPKKILISLYNTLILPYFTYCNVIWGSTYASRIKPLFILQKRAIRYICNEDYRYHTAPLFASLNILNVYDLNRYYIGIFIFNLLHNRIPSIFKNYFELRCTRHPYPSRALNHLSIPLFRLKLSQLGIRFTGAKLWNSLPFDITACKTLSMFKRCLKVHLISHNQ